MSTYVRAPLANRHASVLTTNLDLDITAVSPKLTNYGDTLIRFDDRSGSGYFYWRTHCEMVCHAEPWLRREGVKARRFHVRAGYGVGSRLFDSGIDTDDIVFTETNDIVDPCEYFAPLLSYDAARPCVGISLDTYIHRNVLARWFDPLPDPARVSSVIAIWNDKSVLAFRVKLNIAYLEVIGHDEFPRENYGTFHYHSRDLFKDESHVRFEPPRLDTHFSFKLTAKKTRNTHFQLTEFARQYRRVQGMPQYTDLKIIGITDDVVNLHMKASFFDADVQRELLRTVPGPSAGGRGRLDQRPPVVCGKKICDAAFSLFNQLSSEEIFSSGRFELHVTPVGFWNTHYSFAMWWNVHHYLVGVLLALMPLKLNTNVLYEIVRWLPTVCLTKRSRLLSVIVGINNSTVSVLDAREF
jgi:hypothetical protein